MESSFIRAKAKDTVDALDNLTAYLHSDEKDEVVGFVKAAFSDIEQLLEHSQKSGSNPTTDYKVFLTKFEEYWNNPPQ